MVAVLTSIAPAKENPVDFATDVVPILESYCLGCHTVDEANGGLVMESFAQLMAGGDMGEVIVAGDPESSRLYMMAAGRLEPVMPPDDLPGPSSQELEILRRWIAEGALRPAAEATGMPSLNTPQIPVTSSRPLPVTAMAVSPDGKQIAVARYGVLEILDFATRTPIAQVADLPGKINDVRYSRDGQQLVVASGVTGLYGAVRLIDSASGKTLQTMNGHCDTLYAAALSPDGRWIASAGYDRDVQLWDASNGKPVRTLKGHNGAIFDLAFSADGTVLATASADETVKLWRISDGVRLDTLSQPQGEVWCVVFSPDDSRIVAGSADNRFRVWAFESTREPRINTLLETRFADESPLVRLAFTPNGNRLLVASQAGNMGLFETIRWRQVTDLKSTGDAVSEVVIVDDGRSALVADLSGEISTYDLGDTAPGPQTDGQELEENYLQVDSLVTLEEPSQPHDSAETAVALPRGAQVDGRVTIGEHEKAEDWYRFSARRGEVWMIEVDATPNTSSLDPIVDVCDASGQRIVRTRLQAIRESYFTFRGKDSTQTSDFRLFDWQEMELNDLLYSSGEVTRLWMYPRGPDSGFNVYPGTGNRHTLFDTTPITHALQEPAYVVRPLAAEEAPIANGLPVFTIYYSNDDDSLQRAGTNSRLRFTAPETAEYTIRVADTRGIGGQALGYRLTLRPASPGFTARVDGISKPIPAGGGREFRVSVDRVDGFTGPVTFEIDGLGDGLNATRKVTIEEGQQEAYGVVWADQDVAADTDFGSPQMVARATILGRVVEHKAGDLGNLKTASGSQLQLRITADGEATSDASGELTTLRLKPGETISAIVHVTRNGNDGEIKLGNEFAGRNLPHGVFVDNIGLNGLMILKGADQQQFFITAAPISATGRRMFHLKAEVDGGICSPPIYVEITE
jgi:WD40 repeat protein